MVLSKKIAQEIKHLSHWHLFTFGSQIVTYVDRITQGQIFEYISREHSVESWLIQASWVPQHLMAASVVITSCYFIFSINKNSRWISSLVISILISTGVGSSTWVGGVTFAVISFFYSYSI